MDSGAADYIQKSENIVPELLVRIPNALSHVALKRQSDNLHQLIKESFRHEIIGSSAVMTELRATIESLKGSPSPVLITGESGTGKEPVARRIHAIEADPHRPFFAINCGAIPENLIESELFGHVAGAFTGANANKAGKFALADGGDLFLDEIGELPLAAQAKLLRVLQEGEFSPVGSNEVLSVNVRVLAATNRPLEDWIRDGKFREDLFYRLNVFRIHTEALRNHPQDIPDLARFFVTTLCGPKYSISEEAVKYLSRQSWPGNVRELANAIERALINLRRRNDTVIEKQDFAVRIPTTSLSRQSAAYLSLLPKEQRELSAEAFQQFMEAAEREYLRNALELCDGNVAKTASVLGHGRSTLFKKINRLDVYRSPSVKTQVTEH